MLLLRILTTIACDSRSGLHNHQLGIEQPSRHVRGVPQFTLGFRQRAWHPGGNVRLSCQAVRESHATPRATRLWRAPHVFEVVERRILPCICRAGSSIQSFELLTPGFIVLTEQAVAKHCRLCRQNSLQAIDFISWRSLGESNPCFSLERAAS
jgi:hypothetical protein